MAGKVDLDKMREFQDSNKQGGEFFQFDSGETLLYIHPPCREDDEYPPTQGLPCVPFGVHYKVGSKGAMVISLDPASNPIVAHPFVKKFLKEQKKRLTGSCPVKEAIESGALADEAADEARFKQQFLWGVTPVRHRAKPTGAWTELNAKPSVAIVGKQINDGIINAFFENGDDLTNPDGAVLVKVKKEGKDRNTKYTVTVDTESTRKAYKLSKGQKAALLKALEVGGDCDLFRIVSSLIKPPSVVEQLLDGSAVSSEPDDVDDDNEDEDDDEADLERARVEAKAKKAGAKGKKAAPPPEDDDEDEDEEDEPPPPKNKGKKAPPPPEDEDEDEDEDDEDPPPPPKKASKATPPPAKGKKAAPPPEDDDEDEDEDEGADDEDEDDEDPPPPPKKSAAKAKPAPAPAKGKAKAAKKPADDEDDEDDLGLEGLDVDEDDE